MPPIPGVLAAPTVQYDCHPTKASAYDATRIGVDLSDGYGNSRGTLYGVVYKECE
jgi:hypothetical protein